MSQEPAVSVIIPAYNAASYIADALDSVLAQTFTDYEVVIVNDGSPDTADLERVLQPYRDKITYIEQENKGVSGARNAAIRAARAPLVAQLDADDVWESDYLAVQVGMMRLDPSIDVLYPNVSYFGDGAEGERTTMDFFPSEGEVTFESLIRQQCTVTNCATSRRSAVVRAGLFDETLKGAEDFDLWLRVAKSGGRIAYHRRVLSRYRRRPGSLTSDPTWMYGYMIRVLDKAESTMNLSPGEQNSLRETRARFQAERNLAEGKKAFFRGDTKTAIDSIAKANDFYSNWKLSVVLSLLRFAPRMLWHVYTARDRLIFRTSTKF